MALTLTNDILKFRESTSDPWEKLLIQANINFNLIYPVGSIYMSTVNVDPGTIFGGTWERLKDKFLLGAGDTYTAGDTGGEATHAHTTGNHTLTINEIPSHTHYIYGGNNNDPPDWFGGSGNPYGILQRAGTTYDYLSYTGGGQAHNHGNTGSSSNMPPYIVVYMWKRLTLSPTIYTPPANVLIGEVASEDVVPVSKGGTGASNAEDAIANLGLDETLTGIVVIEDDVTVGFSAGTIGSRGFQKTYTNAIPAGKKLISAVVYSLSDSSSIIPFAFGHDSNLYVNAYRATSSAVSSNHVYVRFVLADS